MKRENRNKILAFTLVELLIVIGILAVLATVAVLFLNPIQFMAQGRDARRISDLKNLDTSISLIRESLYETLTDNTQPNIVYTSLPDLNGDGLCSEYALPPLGGSWQYRCRASADNFRKVDGSGWIPIDFTSVSTNPLIVLPIDPINSQDNYYTYSWDASNKSTIAAKLESEKYLDSYANNTKGDGGNDDLAFETWPITWATAGTPTSGFALAFDGEDDYVEVADESGDLNITDNITLEAWVKPNTTVAAADWRTIAGKQIGNGVSNNEGYSFFIDESQNTLYFHIAMVSGHVYTTYTFPSLDTWYHIVGTFQSGPVIKLYINGEMKSDTPNTYGTGPFTGQIASTEKQFYIGGDPFNDSLAPLEFDGSIDEVRIYSRVLSPAEINEHYQGVFSNESGLAGLWSFEEGTGTTAADGSGNGNMGILFNPPSDYALQFDGNDDYVEVADSDSLDLANEITIEAWVKRNNVGAAADWRTIITKNAGSPEESYALIADTDQTTVYFAVSPGAGVSYVQYNSPSTVGEWQHIVGVYSSSIIWIYVNYGLSGGGVGGAPITISSQPVFIGGNPGTGWAPYEFNGLINEIRIYGKVLPPDIVKRHFMGDYSLDNTGCGGDCDLRAYWKLDEGSGLNITDSSGNGNNGILLNGVQWINLSSLNGPQWFVH